jgi:hypothetical protein
MQGSRRSLSTLLLSDCPESPTKVWSWKALSLSINSPSGGIANCVAIPNDQSSEPTMEWMFSVGGGVRVDHDTCGYVRANRDILLELLLAWYGPCDTKRDLQGGLNSREFCGCTGCDVFIIEPQVG